MHVRFRSSDIGDYVKIRVFVGRDVDHLQLSGDLTLHVGEYQLFGAALCHAAGAFHGQLTFDDPDEEELLHKWREA